MGERSEGDLLPEDTRPGDVLAGRYRLTDLLTEQAGGRFWRAFDSVLQRDVAVHIIASDDERAPLLREAARTSATVLDRRMLRVLDIDEAADRCFVVNEWGSGTSMDILLATLGPLSPTVAAWIVAEVGDALAQAHAAGVAHGRLVPENVLIDHDGAVRIIGFCVEAALHGLQPGRPRQDVVDLVGLLYAGLTGRWAGVSRSAVPAAPSEHGHVLRPRQVRAGIPRTLDAMCDHVLDHGGEADLSAPMVSDMLHDFLGTSARAAEAWLMHLEHPPAGHSPVALAPLPDPPAPDSTTDVSLVERSPADPSPAGPEETAAPGDGVPEEDEAVAALAAEQDEPDLGQEIPTQAGLPIFHDDDEVTWIAQRTEAAPPPPALEPPPERPLFAPDPADGGPPRRPRNPPPNGVVNAGGFWPWEGAGTGPGTGSGVLPAYVEDEPEDERRPGTTWLRLAAVVAACLLVLIASVIAFNLGRGRTPLGAVPEEQQTTSGRSPSSSPTASAGPIRGVTATDFDPQGDPPEENPEEAPLAVDGDPSTAWTTSRYNENLGPAGLKTGVGLVLDLGASHQVTQVGLTTVGTPTGVRIFVLPEPPSSLAGKAPAGGTTVAGTSGTVRLASPATGRYVVVWLTSLPAVPDGFRGAIAEVVVDGE
jgi:serine/threonine kinase PknH